MSYTLEGTVTTITPFKADPTKVTVNISINGSVTPTIPAPGPITMGLQTFTLQVPKADLVDYAPDTVLEITVAPKTTT